MQINFKKPFQNFSNSFRLTPNEEQKLKIQDQHESNKAHFRYQKGVDLNPWSNDLYDGSARRYLRSLDQVSETNIALFNLKDVHIRGISERVTQGVLSMIGLKSGKIVDISSGVARGVETVLSEIFSILGQDTITGANQRNRYY